MANYRRGRINERIREELCTILTRVKDPRVSGAFISITMADCTPDLKYAKIYFSVIGGEKEQREAKAGLDSAAGFIRGQLAHALDLRQTPELKFIPDDSIKNGAHINELLKQVDAGADEDDYE
ncbi:MAG: 30S ribosome-binding factor RbfA [Firmicutes bacterium]|nr:30S ribosome-binding factor RbfA [Bacillota bacterium]